MVQCQIHNLSSPLLTIALKPTLAGHLGSNLFHSRIGSMPEHGFSMQLATCCPERPPPGHHSAALTTSALLVARRRSPLRPLRTPRSSCLRAAARGRTPTTLTMRARRSLRLAAPPSR